MWQKCPKFYDSLDLAKLLKKSCYSEIVDAKSFKKIAFKLVGEKIAFY